jgi:hypothetical protein
MIPIDEQQVYFPCLSRNPVNDPLIRAPPPNRHNLTSELLCIPKELSHCVSTSFGHGVIVPGIDAIHFPRDPESGCGQEAGRGSEIRPDFNERDGAAAITGDFSRQSVKGKLLSIREMRLSSKQSPKLGVSQFRKEAP